jgi:hypothetical protein
MAKNKLCGWGFCVTSLESVKIELTQNAQLRRTEFDENMQPFNDKSRHKFPPSSNPPLFPNILPTPHLPQLQDIVRFPRASPLTFLLQETKIPTARITITSTITPPNNTTSHNLFVFLLRHIRPRLDSITLAAVRFPLHLPLRSRRRACNRSRKGYPCGKRSRIQRLRFLEREPPPVSVVLTVIRGIRVA